MRNKISFFIVSLSVLVLSGCQSNRMDAPFFGFQPSLPMASQANLAESVQSALARSGDPALSGVRVESMQNQVTLKGYVKKIRQSDTAEQIARQVPGVQTVVNHIIVRP